MIPDGPRAGWLHTENALGIAIGGGGGDPDPGGGDIIIPGQWWQPYSSVSVLATVGRGFTQITLPTDARMIYLSETGLDGTGRGLTPETPCRTLYAAAGLIRQGMGDILCIKRGESTIWDIDSGTRNRFVGGAPGRPTIITWYGTGTRPKIVPSQPFDRTFHSHMWFVGINWVNPYAQFGNPLFNGGATKRNLALQSGGISYVLVEDCQFTGVELLMQVQGGLPMRDFTVRRNIWDYVYFGNSSTTNSTRPSCIYSQYVDNLTIEENVHDYCGWHPAVTPGTYGGVSVTGAGANQYNHCYYISEGSPYDGPLIRHNLISRPSSHGWQLRSGGIAYRNTVIYAAIGGQMGYTEVRNGVVTANKGIIPAGRVLRMQENLILRTNGMYRMLNSCQGGVCTSAQWGLEYSTKDLGFDESQAIWESLGNVVAETSTALNNWPSSPSQNRVRENWRYNGVFSSTAPHNWVTRVNNRFWHFTNGTEGDGLFADPGRSLEGYLSMLAQQSITYDAAMNVMKSRGAYEWHSELTPQKIHEYIMAGYEPA